MLLFYLYTAFVTLAKTVVELLPLLATQTLAGKGTNTIILCLYILLKGVVSS